MNKKLNTILIASAVVLSLWLVATPGQGQIFYHSYETENQNIIEAQDDVLINHQLNLSDSSLTSGLFQSQVSPSNETNEKKVNSAYLQNKLDFANIESNEMAQGSQSGTCQIGNINIDGDSIVCLLEEITFSITGDLAIPEGGGYGIMFANENGPIAYNSSDPFTIQSTVTENEFVDVFGIVCTNANDPFTTICASTDTLTIEFKTADQSPCNTEDYPCLLWSFPSSGPLPAAGNSWSFFPDNFDNAPCNDGDGCPIQELPQYEVWAGEAYRLGNLLEGGVYTFSICNGPSAGAWLPNFTIIGPGLTIDAFGTGDGCSITWTASQTGAYRIVITELGQCGMDNTTGNGYPSFTCETGTVNCDNVCSVGNISDNNFPASEISEICTYETVELIVIGTPPFSPEQGGLGLLIENEATEESYIVPDINFPIVLDNDLNGWLSGNGNPPLLGEWNFYAVAYADADNEENTICAISSEAHSVNFLSSDNPICGPCFASDLLSLSSTDVCWGHDMVIDWETENELPSLGALSIDFSQVGNEEAFSISVTNTEFPYSFDHDLNGLLSDNDFDLLTGEWLLTPFVSNDLTNPQESICSFADNTLTVFFAEGPDDLCNPYSEPCAFWSFPTFPESGTDWNDQFFGAPCNEGLGCPTYIYESIPAYAGGAQSIDNFVQGGTYTLSLCSESNELEWNPNYTIIAPSGVIDAHGAGEENGCSITWTASESGTYTIVINDAANCGDFNFDFSATASLTCESESTPCAFICEVGEIDLDNAPNTTLEICPQDTVAVNTTLAPSFPEDGGYRLKIINNDTDTYYLNEYGSDFSFVLENTLGGLTNTSGLPPISGLCTLQLETYSDTLNPDESICSVSDLAFVDFIPGSDPNCVLSATYSNQYLDWKIFPNPTTDYLNLIVESAIDLHSFELYDISGRLVDQKSLRNLQGSVQIKFSVDKLKEGLYKAVLTTASGIDSKRIVITR